MQNGTMNGGFMKTTKQGGPLFKKNKIKLSLMHMCANTYRDKINDAKTKTPPSVFEGREDPNAGGGNKLF